MPLLGHAFVGLATGMAVPPFSQGRPAIAPRQQVAAALWIPIAVVLAYLPDLATQAGLVLGLPGARAAGHSALFALAVAPIIAALGAALGGLPPVRLLGVALGSVLLHDVLDVAQSTAWLPWWPLSRAAVNLGVTLIPANPRREAIAFAALFALFAAGHVALRRRPPPEARTASGPRWAGRVLVVGLIAAAAITHHLRDSREQRLGEARALIAQRRHPEALAALDDAERWPSTAKPGRIDHLRGEAWFGLGNRARAEDHYRRSLEADPDFFWLVADLAMFHASGDLSSAERRARAAPYLERLRRDFARHPALSTMLARIDRRLARPPTEQR